MKALVVHAGAAALREVPSPEPVPGEALVRPLRMALGPGELPSAGGARSGTVIGREFVGVVERVEPAPGRTVGASLVGKRVVGSAHASCGVCDRCRSGLSAHCRSRVTLGDARPGCCAELLTIAAANLLEVPPSVSDDEAVLAPAVAAAVHIAGTVPGNTRPFISVLGDTAEGLLVALLLWRRKETVRMLTAGPVASAVCEKWGLRHRPLNEAGRRQDQDLVIETAGSAASLITALEFVRPRGRVLVTRACEEPAGVPPARDITAAVLRQEVELCGVRGEDFPGAIHLLKSASVQLAPLITRRGTFEQGPDLLNALNPADHLRVVLAAPAR
ncbi:MAG: alcohol dehydrogenase catalytic domain-containing protein [Phycisphaerales bacterium]|nr:alcohol dehydrogenase catalytic domain-containing protein [Phycisphaerales bacterium]